jgi:HAE1 family hydrophobic/amphiphilic exporter-1
MDGKNRVRAAYDGTAEMEPTVTYCVVVFLPIAMSTGLVSISLQFCVTVIISTLFSLLASFTIILGCLLVLEKLN